MRTNSENVLLDITNPAIENQPQTSSRSSNSNNSDEDPVMSSMNELRKILDRRHSLPIFDNGREEEHITSAVTPDPTSQGEFLLN